MNHTHTRTHAHAHTLVCLSQYTLYIGRIARGRGGGKYNIIIILQHNYYHCPV